MNKTKIGHILNTLANAQTPLSPKEIAAQTPEFTITELYPYIRTLEQKHILTNTNGTYQLTDTIQTESYLDAFNI